MKKIFIIISIVSIQISAQVFTLEQSIESGLAKSKTLNIYKARQIASAARVDEISSQFYPQFTLGMGYTRLSDIPPFEVSVPLFPNPITIQDPILNAYTLRAGFQFPLFLGFKLTSLKNASEKNLSASDSQLDAELNNEAFRIHEAFWNYFKAAKSVGLIEQSLNAIRSHLKDAENGFNAGLVQKKDVLALRMEAENLNSKLIEAQNREQLAKTVFNKSVGINLTADSKVISDASAENRNDYKLTEILKEAVQNRKELAMLAHRENAGAEMVSAEKSGYYPTVSVFGDFYYNRPNQRILPLEDKFNETWDVGIALNWSVFDWGKTSAKIMQAEQSLAELSLRKAQLEENIQTEVVKNYSDHKNALAQITAKEAALISAKENLKVVKNLFAQQMANSSELADAETMLLKAELELTFARIDSRLSETRLLKSIGRKVY